MGGTVPYFAVDLLDVALERFGAREAEVYRGPLRIEDGRRICQVLDPFGNVRGTGTGLERTRPGVA